MPARARRPGPALAVRFVALMVGLALLAAALLLGWAFASPAAELNPAERALLGLYLAARTGELSAPGGVDAAPITFAVEQGDTAGAVAERLAALGLVRDARLLRAYLRYHGLDSSIEAGTFILRQTMSPQAIAGALIDAQTREIPVRLTEGWRLEQIAAALAGNPDLSVAESDFLALAGPNGPRVGGYSFIGDLPRGASLEGFLFPDTYLLRPGAAAPEVLQKLLANFDAQLPADFRSQVTARGLTLYQAVTLASLIEREAALDEERPLIASVILNRLAAGQALEIDATVQYVVGTAPNWWPRVDALDFRSLASPYNTYYVTGLPAGPIANPGRASLLAVSQPAQTNYYYYRARCDGSGRHLFAATYEEHLANACS